MLRADCLRRFGLPAIAILLGLGIIVANPAGAITAAWAAAATLAAENPPNTKTAQGNQPPKTTARGNAAESRHPAPPADAKQEKPKNKSGDNSPFPEFSENHGPISITSDSLSLDYKKNTVLFKGHVRVVQAGGVLTTNSLLVIYNKAHEIERAIADGNVRMSQGERWVTSDHAVLNQTNHTIELTGNPVAHNAEDQVTGTKITVYLQTGKSVVDGDARAVFFPRPTKSADNQLTRRATGGVRATGGNQVSADPAP